VLAAAFFAVSVYFVWRSFYGMRIGTEVKRAGDLPIGELAAAQMGADVEAVRTRSADQVR
jgi:hypothetical protein